MTITSGSHSRVYTKPTEATEWSPNVVRPEGKIASFKDSNPSIVYDETWVVKNGHIVRE